MKKENIVVKQLKKEIREAELIDKVKKEEIKINQLNKTGGKNEN